MSTPIIGRTQYATARPDSWTVQGDGSVQETRGKMLGRQTTPQPREWFDGNYSSFARADTYQPQMDVMEFSIQPGQAVVSHASAVGYVKLDYNAPTPEAFGKALDLAEQMGKQTGTEWVVVSGPGADGQTDPRTFTTDLRSVLTQMRGMPCLKSAIPAKKQSVGELWLNPLLKRFGEL